MVKHLSEGAQKDYQLVQDAIENNSQQAFNKLMNKYHDAIYYMLLKMVNNREDAEDLTIETFSKAFNKLNSYTPTYAFSTWLFKIASNHSIDFLRKKKLNTLSIDQEVDGPSKETVGDKILSDYITPEEDIIKKQRINSIHKIVESINPKYAKLISLRFFDELSYEEIAKELDIPLGTVKVQLHRAKALLSNVMKEGNWES